MKFVEPRPFADGAGWPHFYRAAERTISGIERQRRSTGIERAIAFWLWRHELGTDGGTTLFA